MESKRNTIYLKEINKKKKKKQIQIVHFKCKRVGTFLYLRSSKDNQNIIKEEINSLN